MGLGTEGGGLGRSGVMEGKEKIWGREKRDGCQEGGHKEEESSKFEMRNKIRFSQKGMCPLAITETPKIVPREFNCGRVL